MAAIADICDVMKENPKEKERLVFLVATALFSHFDSAREHALMALGYRGRFRRCFTGDNMLFIVEQPTPDDCIVYYVGEVPKNYLGKEAIIHYAKIPN